MERGLEVRKEEEQAVENGFRYQEEYIENVQESVEIVERIQQLIIRELDTVAEQMTELADTMKVFGNSVLRAEQIGNQELIMRMMKQVLPQFHKLSQVIQENSTAVTRLAEENIYDELEGRQAQIRVLFPDSVVHVVADGLGNAGDYILGRSQRKLIERSGEKTLYWNVVHVGRPVTEDFIDICNRSRGVVIGGGGLFLSDSNVNDISGWQWSCSIGQLYQIKAPVYVMGVGYNRFRGQEDFDEHFADNINALVEKSTFFGLRNHGSIRAIRNYLREELWDRVKYFPCATTVLSRLYRLPERTEKEPFIAVNCAFDRTQFRYGGRQDEIMNAVARVLRTLSKSYPIRCYVQCNGDVELLPYLEQAGVAYEAVDLVREMTEEEYLRYYTEPELVLAVRGHAQMIPFGCGTPVVSIITHDKLAWFLEDIGHPEWGVEVTDPDFEEKVLDLSHYMLRNREQICREIDAAKDMLWQALQAGLERVRF